MAKATKRRPAPKRQPSTAESVRLEKRRQLKRIQAMEREIKSTANRLQRLIGTADSALHGLALYIMDRQQRLEDEPAETNELGVEEGARV